MYSILEIELLMRQRDKCRQRLYDANLEIANIRRKYPDLFLQAKQKHEKEKETVDRLLKYIKARTKEGARRRVITA
jgi:hypothetical protein